MTIDEAIRLLNLDIESAYSTPPVDLDKAEQLGIEALKREQYYRRLNSPLSSTKLPSETKG